MTYLDSSYPGQGPVSRLLWTRQLNLGCKRGVKFLDHLRIISFSTQAVLHLICELVRLDPI
jgi:hypothetical protein